MNYMPEVLKMLNLEVGEKFKIKRNDGCVSGGGICHLNNYGLINENGFVDDHGLRRILTGQSEIEKIPWKPKYGDLYFYHDGSEITCADWLNGDDDYYRYNAGNRFKTAEEITPEIKQRILREMKGKYEGE